MMTKFAKAFFQMLNLRQKIEFCLNYPAAYIHAKIKHEPIIMAIQEDGHVLVGNVIRSFQFSTTEKEEKILK